MSVKEIIETKLKTQLNPEYLEIIDESHNHEGHGGYRPGGETHFQVKISSSKLDGLSKVQKHQTIYKILEDELKTQVHALSIKFV